MDSKDLMDILHRTLAEQLLSRVQDPEAKSADLNVCPSVSEGQWH